MWSTFTMIFLVRFSLQYSVSISTPTVIKKIKEKVINLCVTVYTPTDHFLAKKKKKGLYHNFDCKMFLKGK